MVTAWRPLLRQVVTILDLAGTQYLNRQPEKRLYASRVGIDSGEGAGRCILATSGDASAS